MSGKIKDWAFEIYTSSSGNLAKKTFLNKHSGPLSKLERLDGAIAEAVDETRLDMICRDMIGALQTIGIKTGTIDIDARVYQRVFGGSLDAARNEIRARRDDRDGNPFAEVRPTGSIGDASGSMGPKLRPIVQQRGKSTIWEDTKVARQVDRSGDPLTIRQSLSSNNTTGPT